MPETRAIAIVGDELEDRAGRPLDAARLAALGDLLEAAYPTGPRARFAIGASRLIGLLEDGADPIVAVLHVGLLDDAPRGRWAIAETNGAMSVPANGAMSVPADWEPAVAPEAAPEALEAAPEALEAAPEALDALALARARRDRLIVRTGEPGADRLLDAIAPLLAELLDELTERQRPVARMLLLGGLRQSDVADALGVSRATVSVMVGRGRVRSIERLAGAVRAVTAAGLQARRAADRRPVRAGVFAGRVAAAPSAPHAVPRGVRA